MKIYGIAVAGCDRDRDKARLFQKKYGANIITDDHTKGITDDVDIVNSSHLSIQSP